LRNTYAQARASGARPPGCIIGPAQSWPVRHGSQAVAHASGRRTHTVQIEVVFSFEQLQFCKKALKSLLEIQNNGAESNHAAPQNQTRWFVQLGKFILLKTP
jgi:hypothetical protein